MNTQIKLPATFALHVSERHPLADTLPKGELSDFDRSKLYYHCSIHSDGKTIAIESPVFSKDADAEKLRAYSILRELITETITRALLHPTECPQFERINGVLISTGYQQQSLWTHQNVAINPEYWLAERATTAEEPCSRKLTRTPDARRVPLDGLSNTQTYTN